MRRPLPHPLVLLSLVAGCLLLAAPAAVAGDSSSNPTRLDLSVPEQANTAGYGVDGGEQNTTAPFTQQCFSGHNVGVARTAWYRFRGNGNRISVTSEGSDYDTALFVYGDSASGPLLGCNDDLFPNLQSSLTLPSARGRTYAVQVGRACNETGPPTCASNPAGGNLRVTARDIEEAPRLTPRSSFAVRFVGRFTRFTSLNVSEVPRGSKVTVQCKSRRRGCRFRRSSRTVRSRRTLRLGRLVKRSRLRAGAKITIRVTRRGFIGWARTHTVRRGKLPRRKTYCLNPGSSKLRRRCG